MKILAGNSNRPLAEAIVLELGQTIVKAGIRRFADMEVFVEIEENMRGEDVFLIQSTAYPANDNMMELLVCIDALRRASVYGSSWICGVGSRSEPRRSPRRSHPERRKGLRLSTRNVRGPPSDSVVVYVACESSRCSCCF